MAEYDSKTIHSLVDEIYSKGNTILPAIQRNFVWPQEKICKLFDSLLNDYPIGTFLFWRVDKKTVSSFTFNRFLLNYREQRSGIPRGERVVNPELPEYTGVLDGQQRITALLIGLKGSYRVHIKRKSWDKEESFEELFLCVNLLALGPIDEESPLQRFGFIPKEMIRDKTQVEAESPAFWVKVSDVLPAEVGGTFDAASYVEDIDNAYFGGKLEKELMRTARLGLTALFSAFCDKNNINYYSAVNRGLPAVVEVFVRVNSGGQKLSASDLMLSVASGEYQDDAQVRMSDAIEDISNAVMTKANGFCADKDLILTAGLMFTGAEKLSLQYEPNYTVESIKRIFDRWDLIIESIKLASKYIEYLGFIGNKLTSKNLILPIAYYFFSNPSIGESHIRSTTARAVLDRALIGQWLNRAMIKSIFSDGTGSTLLAIRTVIGTHGGAHFPLKELMAIQGKRSLQLTNDTVDEILEYSYSDSRILPLLIVLNNGAPGQLYAVDHIWAKKLLSGKTEFSKRYPEGTKQVQEKYHDACNSLANLQLLESSTNSSKGDTPYDEWISSAHPNRSDPYFANCLIPVEADLQYTAFLEFCKAREAMIKARITECFPKSYDDILKKYGLADE